LAKDFFRPFRQGTVAPELPVSGPFKEKCAASKAMSFYPVTPAAGTLPALRPKDGSTGSRATYPLSFRRRPVGDWGLVRKKKRGA